MICHVSDVSDLAVADVRRLDRPVFVDLSAIFSGAAVCDAKNLYPPFLEI